MPPKKFKSMQGAELSEAGIRKFPFQVGDDVEMRSFENGYRGAWFRVQIKKMRRDKKNKVLCTMGYRDYSDESEEEIYAFEKDPASNELSLMIRPTPPPSVKESNFNKSVDTKMCVIYRDEWEVGDLVDWWYHDCWWAAKVVQAGGNSKFQIACPAPPCGEGGVYLANSRDLRPSLRWSEKTSSWSAPPSKEIGKQPCARIVWLLDKSEVAAFNAPNHRRGLLPQRRGRPKMMRRFPLPRKETTLTDGERGSIRGPRMVELADLRLDRSFSNQQTLYPANRNKVSKVAQKRGRPRKVDILEEEVTKRKKPLSIRVIYPREDAAHEKESTSVADEPRIEPETQYETHHMDTQIRANTEEKTYQANENMEKMEDGEREDNALDENCDEFSEGVEEEDAQEKDPHEKDVPRWGRNVYAQPHPQFDTSRNVDPKMSDGEKQMIAERRRGTKQRRSVIYIPSKGTVTGEIHFSNGHSQEVKRRKLDHIRRSSEVEQVRNPNSEAEAEIHIPQRWNVISNPNLGGIGLRDDLTRVRSKRRRKQKKFGGTISVRKSMLLNCVDNAMVQRMGNLIPPEQMSLPLLDEGKEVIAHEVAGEQPNFTMEGQNQEIQSDIFGSNFMLTSDHGESLIEGMEANMAANDISKESEEESKESQILKVLSAYQEAFTDRSGLDMNNLYSDSNLEAYQDSVIRDDTCSERQKNLSLVSAYGEQFTKDIWAPRRKPHLTQETPPLKTKQSKPWELLVPKEQDKHLNSYRVSSPRKSLPDVELRNKLFQDRYAKENEADIRDVDLSHDIAIRREASSLDTISGGGSQESFSGRWGNVGADVPDEATKHFVASHGGASGVEDTSGSSLNLLSTQLDCPKKTAHMLYSISGIKGSKMKKYKKELLLKRKWACDRMRTRKVRLSRKLIKQAQKRKCS